MAKKTKPATIRLIGYFIAERSMKDMTPNVLMVKALGGMEKVLCASALHLGIELAMKHPEWAQAALAEIQAEAGNDLQQMGADEDIAFIIRHFPIEASS